MRRAITLLFSICVLNMIDCTGQTHNLLSFFEEIQRDSTVNTLDFGLKNISGKDITDSVAIHYFFNNDKGKLYAEEEAYNMDDNTYKVVRYKRTVEAIFSKKIDTINILCYWIDAVNYLAIYNKTKDTIVSNYPFCVLNTAAGETFTHSVLFPNNYIFSIETTDDTTTKTRAKLIEIDCVNKRFIERKNILLESAIIIENMDSNDEKYKRALNSVGISEKGGLLMPNQEQ